jgi:hypothetical protein
MCGDDVYYSLKNGVLTLTGSGAMYDYDKNPTTGINFPPWYAAKDTITQIVVGKDITIIGNNAFYGCANLESLVFEVDSQLQVIGQSAFFRCEKLSDFVLPQSLKTMSAAFQFCRSATIFYPENASIFDNSFHLVEDYAAYRVENGVKYITIPTASMIKVPENLMYTGTNLKETALSQIGFIDDEIIVQATLLSSILMSQNGSSLFWMRMSLIVGLTWPIFLVLYHCIRIILWRKLSRRVSLYTVVMVVAL